MKSHISAIRAITAEFAGQFIRPFIWIALGVAVTLLFVTSLLAYLVSHWWLLLLIPITILSLAGLIIWLIVRFILKSLSPHMDSQQQTVTKEFVAKLEQTVETLRTPYPMIMLFIVRDIVMRRDAGFISEVTQQSRTLKPEFEKLRSLF